MRQFRMLSLALAGLVGASSAMATAAADDHTSHGGQPRFQIPGRKAKAKKSGWTCPDCQAKMMAETGAPAPVMISGTPTAVMADAGCSVCETSGPAMIAPMPPGYASVGQGDGSMVMASAGDAPGYANVGSTMASSEPAPIGVVRTNYASPNGAPMPAAGAPGMASVGMPPAGQIPYARPDEIPAGMLGGAPHRRPRILSRILGMPDFGRMRAESQAGARSSHAMTSYGPNGGSVTELPGSMVYGK